MSNTAAVIGAGLAGSAVAHALCAAGWQVNLYEAQTAASGASGNWLGAFHPHLTRGDTPLSRLTVEGVQATREALELLTDQGHLRRGVDWDLPGHLQVFEATEQARALDTWRLRTDCHDWVQWHTGSTEGPAAALQGYWFAQGGWASPVAWVNANLAACGGRLTLHEHSPVANMQTLQQTHTAVVVACAHTSLALAPVPGASTGVVKGQITRVHRGDLPHLPWVLSGESYAIGPQGRPDMVLGATYERPAVDLTPSAQADAENLARFRAVLPDWPLGSVVDQRCGLRFVWHDRLPVVGPVPGMPGVMLCTGFASRGLTWAALAARLIRQYCEGAAVDNPLHRRLLPRVPKARGMGSDSAARGAG